MSLRDMQIPKSEEKLLAPPPKSWGRPCVVLVARYLQMLFYDYSLTKIIPYCIPIDPPITGLQLGLMDTVCIAWYMTASVY